MSTEDQTETAFSFRTEEFTGPQAAPAEPPAPRFTQISDATVLQNIQRAVEAVGEATYHWITETDAIAWSPNMEAVIGCKPEAASLRPGLCQSPRWRQYHQPL